MPKFVPKAIAEESWIQLPARKPFAVRAQRDDVEYFRCGQTHGVYLAISAIEGGRAVHSINYETGEQTLVGRIVEHQKSVIGRTAESGIKIMHAIISRQHLSFQLEGPVLIAMDEGSTNGSYILNQPPMFDIDEYLTNHPIDKAAESTMDAIHEAFGPTLDDFLKNYLQGKESQK